MTHIGHNYLFWLRKHGHEEVLVLCIFLAIIGHFFKNLYLLCEEFFFFANIRALAPVSQIVFGQDGAEL